MKVLGGAEPRPVLKPLILKVRPWPEWGKDSPSSEKELNAFTKGFHEQPEPGRLLPALKATVASRALEQPSVHGFFAAAFKAYPAAKRAALAELPRLNPLEQWALLLVLRLSGEEITDRMSGLPGDAKASLREVQPLADPPAIYPFSDPVDPQKAGGLGVPMDHNWAAWMATGDPKYLREIVNLLAWAPDLPALEAFMKAKPGLKGLNASAARGLAYRTAGWSISAFQHSDPQVAGWLLRWQKDPSMPEVIRTQLAGVSKNPAFRQDQ